MGGMRHMKPGSLSVILLLSLLSTNALWAQQPQINAGGIVNAGSYSQPGVLAPGVIFSVFGTALSDGSIAGAASVPLPERLAGARLLVNGTPAPLFYAAPTQINAQFPVELTGLVSVQVEVQRSTGTVTSPVAMVPVAAVSPAIFTWDQNGSGPGAIVRNSDFSKICPAGRSDCAANPAVRGEPIAIFMTGLGAVNGPWASGQAATAAAPTTATTAVTIGGVPATVLYAGLAVGFVGLYQVNVAIPRGISLTDSVSLQVGMGEERLVFCPVGSTQCQAVAYPEFIGADWQIFCPPGSATRTARCTALPPGELDTSRAVALPAGYTLQRQLSNTVTIATANFPHSIPAGGGPLGGIITTLATDPASSATVYAGTAGGGIFKSTDAGQSWTAANSGLTDPEVTVVAIAPSSPETFYAGTAGSGVFKSTAGGQSWSPVNTGIADRNIQALAVHPANPNTIYAGASLLFKSTNGGESWETVNCDVLPSRCSSIRSLAVDPTGTVYVGKASFGVFASNDSGRTWRVINDGSCPSQPTRCFQLGSQTGAINALAIAGAVYAATNVGILKFNGLQWTVTPACPGRIDQRGFCLESVQFQSLAIDPTNPDTVYVGTSGGVSKTTNGGGSWTAVNSGIQAITPQPLVQALAVDRNNPSVVYAGSGTGTGVFKTTNGGDSWSVINSGLTAADAPSLAVDPVNSSTVYAGAVGRGIFKSTTGGQNWVSRNSEIVLPGAIAIDPTNPAIIYACCNIFSQQPLSKTTDGGQSWISLNGGGTRLVIDPANPATLYGGSLGLVGSSVGGGLSRSIDGGQNWTTLTSSLPGSTSSLGLAIYALAINPLNTSTLYAATSSGVLKTTDGGVTWTTVNSGLPRGVLQTPNFNIQGRPLLPLAPTEPVQALAIAPANPTSLYAGTPRGVFKTTNGGQSWTASGLATQSLYTFAISPANPSTLYAGTQDGGVFQSTDGGQTWASSGSLASPVQALAVDPANPSILYAATQGGGGSKSNHGGQNWQPTGTE